MEVRGWLVQMHVYVVICLQYIQMDTCRLCVACVGGICKVITVTLNVVHVLSTL